MLVLPQFGGRVIRASKSKITLACFHLSGRHGFQSLRVTSFARQFGLIRSLQYAP